MNVEATPQGLLNEKFHLTQRLEFPLPGTSSGVLDFQGQICLLSIYGKEEGLEEPP